MYLIEICSILIHSFLITFISNVYYIIGSILFKIPAKSKMSGFSNTLNDTKRFQRLYDANNLPNSDQNKLKRLKIENIHVSICASQNAIP